MHGQLNTTSKFRQRKRLMNSYSCKASINKAFIKKDGTSAVFLLVYVNNFKMTIPLKMSWPVACFDEAQGKLLERYPKDPDVNDLNMIINNEAFKVNDIFKRYRLMEKVLTPALFKHEFKGAGSRGDFIQYFQQQLEIRYRDREIEYDTYRTHRSSLNVLISFREVIPFNEIDGKFLKKYMAFLKKRGLKENTCWGRMKDMRTYLSYAKRENIIFEWPFSELKPSEKPKLRNTKKTFLIREELLKLYHLFNSDKLNIYKKSSLAKYLFSCFTGLRISDNRKIKDMEVLDNELIFLMHKNRKREGKIVKIPLTNIAKDLLENHKECILLNIADQAVNRNLKNIAKDVEINKHLTFHTARHTFATLFLELGGKVEVLQQLMGHTDIKTTMIYVHIAGEHRKEQMRLFNNVLQL